jgi:hypothetical protein
MSWSDQVNWNLPLVLLAVSSGFMLLALLHRRKQERLDIAKKHLIEKLNAAGTGKRWFGADSLCAIGIDSPGRKIHLASSNEPEARAYVFADIMAAELIEDGATTIKTSSSRSIGGAIIGGALLGPAGMVVGGLGGSTTGRQLRDVRAIDVVITILDMERPRFALRVLDAPHGLRAESEGYRAARSDAEELLGVLKVAIETADREAQAAQPEPARAATSAADELEKLAALRDRGILNDEEFQAQKQALLGN